MAKELKFKRIDGGLLVGNGRLSYTDVDNNFNRLTHFSGAWSAGEYRQYEMVTHKGMVLSAATTTSDEPDPTNPDWDIIAHSPLEIFYTPGGGIAARSGTTVSSANCTPYWINDSGTLTELKDYDDDSQTFPVYNMDSSGAVTGSTYILTGWVMGKRVFITEC